MNRMWSDVCRLCLTKDNLVWIFDKRFEKSENMKDVIFITTGVEINTKDIVSQKICKKCYEVTIKMFEFRRASLVNDKYLREKSMQYMNKTVNTDNSETEINEIKDDVCEIEETQDYEKSVSVKVHSTVRNLFKVYPQMILPTLCLKSNISPFVSLPMNQVENYFKARKLDINLYTKLALKSAKVAAKKTSTSPSKTPSYSISTKFAPVLSSENASKRTIPPIRIVQNKVNDEITVANKVNEDVNTGNLKRSANPSRESSPQAKKRKLSENEASKESLKKPAFVESLGLTPKVVGVPQATTMEPPAYVANTSVPLHICDICNSVQYSVKDLKRHQLKHMRCQFCKKRFRTLEQKNRHIDNLCIIKNTMNNVPDLELVKIEYNEEVRRKYPDAFVNFPPLKNTPSNLDDVNKSATVDESVEKSEQTSNYPNIPKHDNCKKSGPTENFDIIEILSDDEEVSAPKTDCNQDNLSNSVLKNDVIETNVIEAETTKSTNPNSITAANENVVYTTVSLVRPDIRIRGNHLLNRIDPKLSDMKILKELIKSKPLRLWAEKNIQTGLPINTPNSIRLLDQQAVELHNLKRQLYVYKIPVEIKCGLFKVSYKQNPGRKRQKKLDLWNDLIPLDIKSNNVKVNNVRVENANQTSNKENAKQNNVVQKNSYVAPATVVRQTVGVPSNVQSTCATTSTPVTCNLPQQNLSSSPKFIRINKSSLINSSLNSQNIIDRNPLLNKFLQVPSTSTSVSTVVPAVASSAPIVSSANTGTTAVANDNVPVGAIRVKNVWELS